jgi:hypothetical protein
VRVALAVSALNASLLPVLLPYVVAPFAVGLLGTIVGLWRQREVGPELPAAGNPLQIGAALKMTALFQAVLFAVFAMNQVWGSAGVFVSGAVLGLTDVDALTISMARIGGVALDPAVAARAIAIGILSNTVMKAMLAITLGRAGFRLLAAAGLLAMAVACAVSLALRAGIPQSEAPATPTPKPPFLGLLAGGLRLAVARVAVRPRGAGAAPRARTAMSTARPAATPDSPALRGPLRGRESTPSGACGSRGPGASNDRSGPEADHGCARAVTPTGAPLRPPS